MQAVARMFDVTGPLVLGIETSCDETAAAVVADGRRILSNVVASQARVHSAYGGVVPELASRHHVEAIAPVIEAAMAESGARFEDLAAVAVTQGPGLVGSLLVVSDVLSTLDGSWVPEFHGDILNDRLQRAFELALATLA